MRRRSRRAAVLVAIGCALAAPAAAAAALTPAEQAFKRAYVKLTPAFSKAATAVTRDLAGAAKHTDPQLVTIFTACARQWATATRPLLALRAPAQEAALYAAIAKRARAVESDLLDVVAAGRTNSVPGAKTAGTRLVNDFTTLHIDVIHLALQLGIA